MAKKPHHEEHENHERWLVSYADFITLLFAFFVVMYSVSRVDNKRLTQVVHSIKFALHFKGSGGLEQMPMFEGPPSEGGCVTNTGSSARTTNVPEVKKEAEKIPVLDVIAGELAALARPVRVEGHTYVAPTGTRRFRDNLELSSSRASA